jgi:single-strand DNA-binding protein
MANFNKAILIGNLCKDVELRYTPQGIAVANIALAINRKYKNQAGEAKEDVAFVPVVLWGRTAEVVNEYCKKGNPLMVEGRIQTRSWEKDGQKHYKTEVLGERIQLLGSKKPAETQEEKTTEEKTTGEEWLSEDQQ